MPPIPCDSMLPSASRSTWWQATHSKSAPSVPMCTSNSRVVFAMTMAMSPCLTLSPPPALAWQSMQPLIDGLPPFMATLRATACKSIVSRGAPADFSSFS